MPSPAQAHTVAAGTPTASAAGTLAFPERRPALLELSGVSKVFGATGRPSVAAVIDVSLSVSAGESVLVRGPSGSGKSTLLKLIGCMMRPSAGRIRIDGREVGALAEDRLAGLRRRHFGFVFQSDHLIGWASALVNVVVPALPCGAPNGELRRRAEVLLEQLGIAQLRHQPVRHLSGGERQRVAIARALINDPRVVIADEPTAHLDERRTREVFEILERLRDDGRTVIVASHDPLLRSLHGSLAGGWPTVLELDAGRVQ